MDRKKIAVLGGSFNPVHWGHIAVARNVVASGAVDAVWLSPSPQNPFKASHKLMPIDERLRLIREAIADERHIAYTDVELSLPIPSYTIDALDALSRDNTDIDFMLLMGADNLEDFCKWKRWTTILEKYGIIVYPRGSSHITLPDYLLPYDKHIILLDDMPVFPISSTLIRESRGD